MHDFAGTISTIFQGSTSGSLHPPAAWPLAVTTGASILETDHLVRQCRTQTGANVHLRRLNDVTHGQQNAGWFVAVQFYQVLLAVTGHVVLPTFHIQIHIHTNKTMTPGRHLILHRQGCQSQQSSIHARLQGAATWQI